MLAERTGLEIESAFSTLRNHARNHNLKLIDVANGVVDGTLSVDALDPARAAAETGTA